MNQILKPSDVFAILDGMFSNIHFILLFGIGTLLTAAVSLGMVGFFWRHIRNIVGLNPMVSSGGRGGSFSSSDVTDRLQARIRANM